MKIKITDKHTIALVEKEAEARGEDPRQTLLNLAREHLQYLYGESQERAKQAIEYAMMGWTTIYIREPFKGPGLRRLHAFPSRPGHSRIGTRTLYQVGRGLVITATHDEEMGKRCVVQDEMEACQ